ncbi:MAG: AAA family ATPase [Alphaproteobacteria bacterium]|nr:AAA family ATPase [Alphaproteobacteria bacterium]
MHTPFIKRITIRNYKSIAACKVDLGPLMFLVGPNGSGKSNFLDALLVPCPENPGRRPWRHPENPAPAAPR